MISQWIVLSKWLLLDYQGHHEERRPWFTVCLFVYVCMWCVMCVSVYVRLRVCFSICMHALCVLSVHLTMQFNLTCIHLRLSCISAESYVCTRLLVLMSHIWCMGSNPRLVPPVEPRQTVLQKPGVTLNTHQDEQKYTSVDDYKSGGPSARESRAGQAS